MSYAIEVKDLHKTYGSGESCVEAVKGITLTVNKGELYGFLGPNGAGKSTSLKMMVGLLTPTSGEVKIFGQDASANRELRTKIGIIPQEISVYDDLSVDENLWFIAKAYDIPKTIAKQRIDSLIERIALGEKRKALAGKLSGGQRRRLNIIMSLIHNPEIVLCDEPTPGLDPQSRVVVWQFIKDLCEKEGKTVVLTTHFMDEADSLCNRIGIIDHGKILVIDTPENLKASIGEGDLLEVSISDDKEIITIRDALRTFLATQDVQILKNGNGQQKITVRCLDVIPKISKILNKIEEYHVDIGDLRIRSTTLEDVFIHLTGRGLRD